MLSDFPIHATVAISDVDRARTWFRDRLGIEPKTVDPGGLWYEFAAGTWLLAYRTEMAGTARNTIAGWTVTGIEQVMADLRSRGVAFEDYDLPGITTVDGLMTMEGVGKAAWFRDVDGNIYELSEVLGS